MTREKKPVNWGVPGQTGVAEDGLPWYVPEGGPTRCDRFLRWLFQLHGDRIPIGARTIPARTPAEVHERYMIKYRDRIRKYRYSGEEIVGFIDFYLNERVPQPPRTGIGRRIGPNPVRVRSWWMGGRWDSAAGQLVAAAGHSRQWEWFNSIGMFRPRMSYHYRDLVLVRTSHRTLFLAGSISSPDRVIGEYAPDCQVGLRPGWTPLKGQPRRVDIAFSDGSWLGVKVIGRGVPGKAEDAACRDLLVELAGPPVVADVLPSRGLGNA